MLAVQWRNGWSYEIHCWAQSRLNLTEDSLLFEEFTFLSNLMGGGEPQQEIIFQVAIFCYLAPQLHNKMCSSFNSNAIIMFIGLYSSNLCFNLCFVLSCTVLSWNLNLNQLKLKLKRIWRAVWSESDLKTINHSFEKQGPWSRIAE